jgi:NAD(P)H-dependent FMN reductase
MKIIAFGASYSGSSINRKLAAYAASQFEGAQVEVLDLRQFELPLYTPEAERALGHPQAAQDFVAKLGGADLIIASMAEHNGSYTAAFKNLFDWASRVKLQMFEGKRLLLLSTAPGPRGGLSVLQQAIDRFPRHGATVAAHFSLPSFAKNFSEEAGILDEALRASFLQAIEAAQVPA